MINRRNVILYTILCFVCTIVIYYLKLLLSATYNYYDPLNVNILFITFTNIMIFVYFIRNYEDMFSGNGIIVMLKLLMCNTIINLMSILYCLHNNDINNAYFIGIIALYPLVIFISLSGLFIIALGNMPAMPG